MALMSTASVSSTAKVRLSDSAVLAGTVSLLYALAVMTWPQAFPKLLERVFYGGHFFRALAGLLVITNELLFVRIYRRRAQKPNPLTFGYIAFLTIAFVSLLWALVTFANVEAFYSHFRLHAHALQGIGSEELLFYTHLGMVSGIFFPYLLIRMTQDFVPGSNLAESDMKVLGVSAGH
jgi:hypothetical protein